MAIPWNGEYVDIIVEYEGTGLSVAEQSLFDGIKANIEQHGYKASIHPIPKRPRS